MSAEPRRNASGLGRGLAALIPQRDEAGAATNLPIAAIARNPYQPRHAVEQASLEQLAASIGEHGVLQPILVTRTTDGYRLVAGERRLRAAEMAGLDRIPAVVRSVDEQNQLAFALIENLQRADLNPLEEAVAFKQLAEEFDLTHEDVARRVGRSRSAVANTIRLLDTADAVQRALAEELITEGHARALGGLDGVEQERLLQLVIDRSLSVRETEELVRRQTQPKRARVSPAANPDLERLENDLREVLATKVRVTRGRRGGKITIDYYTDEDLGRLYERLTGEALP